jgi:hypothetical protein
MMPSCEDHALVIEAAHQHANAAVERAHDPVLGNEAIVEHQLGGRAAAHAHLVDLLADGETLVALFDQEGGDPAAARLG